MEPHKEKFGRYFIAIIPPSPIYEEVEQLKKHFSDTYKSKAALNSPPHVTLHMPFEWKKEKEEMLCSQLKTFFETFPRFEVELFGFSCFAPKTIFISVVNNLQLENLEKELLRFCKKNLNLFNARYKDLPFHPHMTIAFRDLNKKTFAEAWGEFKDQKLDEKFDVLRVALLQHTGKSWEPLHYFSLN